MRVPILNALAAIVSRSYAPLAAGTAGAEVDEADGESKMLPVLTGTLLASIVEAIEVGAQDAKYSQVRFEVPPIARYTCCSKNGPCAT